MLKCLFLVFSHEKEGKKYMGHDILNMKLFLYIIGEIEEESHLTQFTIRYKTETQDWLFDTKVTNSKLKLCWFNYGSPFRIHDLFSCIRRWFHVRLSFQPSPGWWRIMWVFGWKTSHWRVTAPSRFKLLLESNVKPYENRSMQICSFLEKVRHL